MDQAEDRYRYVLERLVIEPPGQRWTYNGGATALLATLIAKGTSQSLKEFAREKLFAPLGIDHAEWQCSSDGEPLAASGLRMRPRDLARIGMAVLGGGAWNGRQVIPAEWLKDSFIPRVSLPEHRTNALHQYASRVRSRPQPARLDLIDPAACACLARGEILECVSTSKR